MSKIRNCFERNLPFPLPSLFETPHLGRRRSRAVVRRAARQHPPVGVAQPDEPVVAAVKLRPAREHRVSVRSRAADRDGRRDRALAGEGRRGVGGEVARVRVGEQAQRRRRLRRQEVHRPGRVVGCGPGHDHRLHGRDRGRAGLERGLGAAGDKVRDREGGDERAREGLAVSALRKLVRRDPHAVRVGADLIWVDVQGGERDSEMREKKTKKRLRNLVILVSLLVLT